MRSSILSDIVNMYCIMYLNIDTTTSIVEFKRSVRENQNITMSYFKFTVIEKSLNIFTILLDDIFVQNLFLK